MGLHEYSIWQNLNHPSIVRCFERSELWLSEDFAPTGKEVKATALFMEYASGGELYDYVKHGGAFKEDAARLLVRQILHGVQHIHSHGIAHLDLKLDNIFVSSAADSANSSSLIKIGDLGLAAFTSWPFKEVITHFVGTKGY